MPRKVHLNQQFLITKSFLTCTEQSVEQHTTGQRELEKIVHFNGFFKSVLIWSDLLEIKPKLNFATFP